jgi:hypothetical protein
VVVDWDVVFVAQGATTGENGGGKALSAMFEECIEWKKCPFR